MRTAPEDWWLVCPTCGSWTRAIDRHIVRRGGRASGERKYLRCDTCTKRRWLRVEARPPGWAPPD